MEDRDTKIRLIVILVSVTASLILFELLLMHLRLGPGSFSLPLHMLEFVVAVSGLIVASGRPARMPLRLCALGIFLAVICWTIPRYLVAMTILPAVVGKEITGNARIGTQRTRSIVIATATAASAIMLFSPFIVPYLSGHSDEKIVFLLMLRCGCIAAVPILILVFFTMSGWTASPGWKVSVVTFHTIFLFLAALAWLFYFADFSPAA